MTDFKAHFSPQDIDQQLEQPFSGVANDSQASFLADLQTFHCVAASAEKQSLASAWERIEYRHRTQQAGFPEKRPLPFHTAERRAEIPPQISPRAHKKRGLVTLVAILIAFLLIGGVALALVQRSLPVAGPATHSGTPASSATPTSGQQQNKTGMVVYTNNDADNQMVLAWSPDGKRVLSAGSEVHIWDATTGQHAVTYHPLTHNIPIQNAAWAPDNSQRVAIADGTSVRIVDANTGNVLLTGPKNASTSQTAGHLSNPQSAGVTAVRAVAWSPDGNEIASSVATWSPVTTSRPITIWNSHTGAIIKQLIGHTDDIYTIAWSPDGKYLASLAQSQDETVRLWNVASGQQMYIVRSTSYGAMERLAWSPDSQYLAVQMQVQVGNNTLGTIVTRDEIQVWKALTHQVLTSYPSPIAADSFTGFSWAPDSTRIVTALGVTTPGQNNVFVWNAFTGQNLYIYRGKHQEMAHLVAWSSDGKYIAQAGSLFLKENDMVNVTEVWNAPEGV
jgi:WD40 repeat protein